MTEKIFVCACIFFCAKSRTSGTQFEFCQVNLG